MDSMSQVSSGFSRLWILELCDLCVAPTRPTLPPTESPRQTSSFLTFFMRVYCSCLFLHHCHRLSNHRDFSDPLHTELVLTLYHSMPVVAIALALALLVTWPLLMCYWGIFSVPSTSWFPFQSPCRLLLSLLPLPLSYMGMGMEASRSLVLSQLPSSHPCPWLWLPNTHWQLTTIISSHDLPPKLETKYQNGAEYIFETS